MKSFRSLVLEAVLGGASDVGEVCAVCGRYVSASRAAQACRQRDGVEVRRVARHGRQGSGRPKRTPAATIARGRRALVSGTLVKLYKDGLIRRVSRGVYAPPLPKVFRAG